MKQSSNSTKAYKLLLLNNFTPIISYKFRTGNLVSEIADEVKAQGYDMLVLTSSHIDSWIRSLFSDTRKIISNVTIPVLEWPHD